MRSVPSLEIKYCLKGLGEGLVQTGTIWISPCSFSQSEEARSLGKVGRRKEGRGERNVGSLSPLGVSALCLGKGQVLPCVCVCVFGLSGTLPCVCLLDLCLSPERGASGSSCPSE